MNRKILPLTLLGTALLLGACGQAPVTQTQTTPKPVNGKLMPLKVRVPFAAKHTADTITVQALPGDGTGAAVVNFVKVKVHKYDNQTDTMVQLTFNDNNVYDANGDHNYITLTPDASSVELLLPVGEYEIESVGKVDNTDNGEDDGVFFAYGTSEAFVSDQTSGPLLTAQGKPRDGDLDLELHTLTDPENSSFEAFAPRKVMLPNQALDLQLNMRTPNLPAAPILSAMAVNANNLAVPSNDYQALYEADGTGVNGNAFGVNLTTPETVNAEQRDFVVNANTWAWVQTGPEKAAWQQLEALEYRVAIADPSTLKKNDFTPPTVTVAASYGLGGTTGDNTNVMPKLRVFEGSTLIGSTEAADGVSSITIDASGNWRLSHTFDVAKTYDFTVVATDLAENESQASLNGVSGVSLQAVPPQTMSLLGSPYCFGSLCRQIYLVPITPGSGSPQLLPPGADVWYKLDLSSNGPQLGSYQIYALDVRNGPPSPMTVKYHYSQSGPEITPNPAGTPPSGWGVNTSFYKVLNQFPVSNQHTYYAHLQVANDGGAGNRLFFVVVYPQTP